WQDRSRRRKMKLKPVESEMLVAAGYDEKSHSLTAVFRTGETYRYKNVPLFVYERLMSAESKGKFMHKYILNRFDYERVTTTTKFREKLKHG
ncbi:MAG TPA: KTSC domain-containing protein, partial [Pyrinomonadaceae bacterium]|nr:KTSC domain-containing protein [Pyrinomonadaceae bacterium]